jgi:RNA polymerase sigma-70 factor (ECF subfamily)
MEPAASFERFDELLAHRDWVRRVARALMGDDAAADDLEQDVWLLAARAERPRSPRAWLGAVLRNTAANLRTSARRRERREVAAPQPRGVPSPEEILERAEIVERVARAVRTLEEPYRTVVFLRYFEDLTPPQIAARLGEPLETVRTRLKRALARLREQLDAEHDGDRRAWLLLLVPVARLQQPAPAAPLAPAAVLGGVAMGVTTKIVLAGAVLVLAGAAAWWVASGTGSAPPPAGTPRPTQETAAAAPAPVAGARTRPRPDVADETSAAARPAAAPEGEAAVGRVVDDVTGAPVAKASVRLGYGYVMDERAPAAVTDESGTFRIEGIGQNDVGTHRLLVAADGYAEALPSVHDWHLRAKPGEPTDLGEFRLERGARVAGRVVAADGTPLPGAHVLFCRDTLVTSPPTFHPDESREAATADAGGRFALEHVPSSPYDWHHTLFAITADGFGWLALPRVAGKKDLADVELRLAPTGVLAVKVRTAGAAVAGARVLAIPHFPPLGTQPQWNAVHDLYVARPELKVIFEATTDASGDVRLARLPIDGAACTYDLAVRADGYALGVLDGVRLAPGEAKEVSVELATFQAAVVTGTVRAPDGTPIAGAEIGLFGAKCGTTDASGAFRIERIDPSKYDHGAWIVVRAPGFAKTQKTFRFPASGDVPPFEFVLDRAVALDVRVVDEAGAIVQGAQVSVREDQTSVDVSTTDAAGRVHFEAAPGPGRVLSFHPPEPGWDWVIPDDVPVPAASGEVRVVLRKVPPSARVVAEVVDAATGKPLDPTNATLVVVDWRKQPRVYGHAPTLESGRVVVDRAFPGDHVLWVATDGHAPARADVRVAEGQIEAKVVVRCGLPGTVRGVVDGDGTRGRGTLIVCLPDGAYPPEWVRLQSDPTLINAVRIAEDGTFRIEGVPPGRLRLLAEFEGSRIDEVVDVQSGAATDVVLHPVTTGRANFRVAEAGTYLVVRFRGAEGDWRNWMSISSRDERPAAWATNVPLGRVRWEARLGRGKTWPAADAAPDASGEFEAKAGETVEVTIPSR